MATYPQSSEDDDDVAIHVPEHDLAEAFGTPPGRLCSVRRTKSKGELRRKSGSCCKGPSPGQKFIRPGHGGRKSTKGVKEKAIQQARAFKVGFLCLRMHAMQPSPKCG
eukprot:jgi/Chrzof1/2969/Cz12g06130.t1